MSDFGTTLALSTNNAHQIGHAFFRRKTQKTHNPKQEYLYREKMKKVIIIV